ncbi:hypothetical protein [Streptomyces radicis]|uniref:Nucleotide exchange factor GrpE n=1 Tax=Streptomyces radicis TaxID=1750517 RepID=A0A3A9W0T8_9ACTN|nr:hypothetical protein [Streptomyces radicis]RKN06881.1 hypothetical protein D7319_21025 [Streptomyces radicis]RKN19499.1 hypothetical protein D7318_20490 [Streptomyces radicis]
MSQKPPGAVTLDADALAEIATAAWRLRNKVEATEDTPPGVRRHTQALADTLAEAGLETRSYEGTPFDPGLRMRVLAYQPTPGLERDEVIETLRPAVYLNGSALTLGEVIVGTPPEEPRPAPARSREEKPSEPEEPKPESEDTPT